jgi:nicotinate-nucleotide pyrophosphorylase (carboxylating)
MNPHQPVSPLNNSTRNLLEASGLRADDVVAFGFLCVAEDLDGGVDVTSHSTIAADDRSVANFVVRGSGVIAGVPVLQAILETNLPADSIVEVHLADGARVERGDVVATVRALTIPLLTIERTALNVICRLSGVATHTRKWVDALEGTSAKVRDTRKTTPGMRDLDKYAVRCGGGVNHRRGLSDAVLIKDNHVVAAGGVGAAVDAALAYVAAHHSERAEPMVVQCEIDRLSQLDEAISHGATQILLDNMAPADMAEAVTRAKSNNPKIKLEASGGLTLDTVNVVAATGVDYIAVGALTHSSPILDIALDFIS